VITGHISLQTACL